MVWALPPSQSETARKSARLDFRHDWNLGDQRNAYVIVVILSGLPLLAESAGLSAGGFNPVRGGRQQSFNDG